MKPSTAVSKAKKHHSLSPIGNQWQIINRSFDGDYVTTTGSTTYAQARQWYKQTVAATALLYLGWDSVDTAIVEFVDGSGTVVDLVERCIEHQRKMK